MTMDHAHQKFISSLAVATGSEGAFAALYRLSNTLVGAKLFTVMCVDMNQMLASRLYTSDPASYPVSGTKPVEMNSWFDIVHTQGRTYVANTLTDIAEVNSDYVLIESLGCVSIVNLPVVVGGELVAIINMLHEEHYYSSTRVRLIETQLLLPSMASWLVHQRNA